MSRSGRQQRVLEGAVYLLLGILIVLMMLSVARFLSTLEDGARRRCEGENGEWLCADRGLEPCEIEGKSALCRNESKPRVVCVCRKR